MKALKIILGVFLTCILFAFLSEGDKAPHKVQEAFAKKFPKVKKVKWEKENTTEWEAEFEMNAIEYSACFLEDGTWQETEHEIDQNEIPQHIKASLIKAFPDYKIEEAEISETKEGIFYEFEIEKGESEMEVTINVDGKIVKQDVEKEDND